MNKIEAESLVAVQDAFRKENPGPFAGIAPGVNEAQLARARRVLDGTEPEDFAAPVVEAAHVGPLTPENEVLTEAARIAAEEKARQEAEAEAARIAAVSGGPAESEIPTDPTEPTAISPAE